MLIEENPLAYAGGQELRPRIQRLNEMALRAAVEAASTMATPTRFAIDTPERALYRDLGEERLVSFSHTPLFLFRVTNVLEQHAPNRAAAVMEVDCEILRRYLTITKDLIRHSMISARTLMGLSTAEADCIHRLSDDGAWAFLYSSRLEIVPRVLPHENLLNDDGLAWDKNALLRRVIREVAKVASAA